MAMWSEPGSLSMPQVVCHRLAATSGCTDRPNKVRDASEIEQSEQAKRKLKMRSNLSGIQLASLITQTAKITVITFEII